MASSLEFVQYVCEQMHGAADITYKHMFGEYGLYAEGKFFAVVCDNRLFFKPTDAVRAAYSLPEDAPYPGAKPYLLLETLDDAFVVSDITRLTLNALPLTPPRPRKKT